MRQFDQQIVESVAIRRQRVRNAVFFGADRWRRQLQDHIKPLMIGIILAALIAAGCIATSFVINLLKQQEEKQRKTAAYISVVLPQSQKNIMTHKGVTL